jgi:formamidopyrimidine-DNA glycosylase
MPELPEVETVVRGLRRVLPGRRIVGVHLGKTDFMDNPVALGEMLPGRRILGVERLGKFIRIPLEAGGTATNSAGPLNLIVHLGMTGRLAVRSPEDPVAPHTHAFFHLDDGNDLRYTDIRRFGQILLLPDEGLAAFCGKLGEDPLEVTAEAFCRQFEGRSARIKSLLLDQRVLRGVGNIYADESLWRARIHPARLAGRLSREELLRLRQALQGILHAAISERGSSISNYLDAEGKPGGYQRWHRVYQRTGEACTRCGETIRRMIVGGRSSHFCPSCQAAPRGRLAGKSRTGKRSAASGKPVTSKRTAQKPISRKSVVRRRRG